MSVPKKKLAYMFFFCVLASAWNWSTEWLIQTGKAYQQKSYHKNVFISMAVIAFLSYCSVDWKKKTVKLIHTLSFPLPSNANSNLSFFLMCADTDKVWAQWPVFIVCSKSIWVPAHKLGFGTLYPEVVGKRSMFFWLVSGLLNCYCGFRMYLNW